MFVFECVHVGLQESRKATCLFDVYLPHFFTLVVINRSVCLLSLSCLQCILLVKLKSITISAASGFTEFLSCNFP